ncbi:glycosyltransferase family 4 protein [Thalassospira sp.]|uniref:glycosyltransferase family 4 protein n=1 Tax=Thalassospira sp. TaxID=1912094 RepID=UPI00273286FD|nr:glycosyltransferase family 4 protein [Thalassospira sp.]MDP2698715.1 glycosyltransferase family 4 protein [Thalassospira sp.]
MTENRDIWMIGRVDQFRILAAHLTQKNRLARWDSFWRTDGTGWPNPAARRLDPVISSIPGRHVMPDILGKAARTLRLPGHNLWSDLPLSWLAKYHMPGPIRLLHGQGNYSLPAMRKARDQGIVCISDVTGQLAPIRQKQLAPEYCRHGRTWREISGFLAQRRTAEARFADAVFAPSETVACGLAECGIAERHIHIIPFDAPRASHLLTQPRRTDGGENGIKLLYVGDIAIAKGIRPLLAAFSMLRHQVGISVTLTLIGPARDCARPYLAALPDGCDWQGKRPAKHVMDALHNADIFVFPSFSEGSSLAVIEAMAANLAVIATPNAGSPIRDGHDGVLTPAGDVTALHTALMCLIHHPALRQNLGAQARATIRHLTAEGYGTRVEAAYERVLSRHG